VKKGLPPWFLLLALAALAARFALLAQHLASPFGGGLLLDERGYWQWAGRIAGGEWRPDAPFAQGPLYPYLLGAARGLSSSLSPAAVAAGQLLANWASCLLFIPLVLRRGGDRPLALATASLALLFAPAAFWSLKVMPLTPGVLLLLLALLALPDREGRWQRGALAGALAGLAVLAVPGLLFAAIALFLTLLPRREGGRPGRATAFLAALLLALLPVTAANFASGGRFVLVSGNFGISFLHGNNPGANGTFVQMEGLSAGPQNQAGNAAVVAGGETGRAMEPMEAQDYLLHKALSWIAGHPLDYLVLEGRKAVLLLGGLDIPVESSLVRERRDFLPALWLLPIAGTALLLLAGVGAVSGGQERILPLPLLLALGAIPLLFLVSNRYVLPLQAFLLPLAGAGALALLRGVPLRLGAGAAAAAVAGCALLSLPVAASPYQEALYSSRVMRLDIDAGKPGQALAEYDRLLGDRHVPPPPPVTRLAAKAHEAQGDAEGALSFYRKAGASDPSDRDTLLETTDLLRRMGRGGEGIALLQAWLQDAPGDPYARNVLSELLLDAGRVAESEAEARRALSLSPGFPGGHLALGLALARQGPGKRGEARAQMEEAARRDPGYAAPWYALALLELEEADLPAARRHLGRAEELGFPVPPEVRERMGL
jgi:tetratricopeptide (TPR) repeat protein